MEYSGARKYFEEVNGPSKYPGEISSRLGKQGMTWRFLGCGTSSDKPYGARVA